MEPGHEAKTMRTKRGLSSSTKLVGLTAFIATFIDGSLYGVLVPILPYSLVERLNVQPEDGRQDITVLLKPKNTEQEADEDETVQFWLSSMLVAFGLANAISSPFIGWACARLCTMRTMYLVAQSTALLATLLMCFGGSLWILILARCLQGVTACAIYVSSIGMIHEMVPSGVRGAWIGFALSGLSASLVGSPFLGGLLYDHGGYNVVFYAISGLIGAAIGLRLSIADSQLKPNLPSFGTCEESPLLPPTTDRSDNRGDGLSLELRRMRLILASPRLRAALLGGFIHTTAVTGFDAVLPLMVQRTFAWGSTLAGTAFLVLALPSLLSTCAGLLSNRFGARNAAACGFLLTICGIWPMALIRHNHTLDHILLYILLATTGLGLTLVLAPLAADVSDVADELRDLHPDLFDRGAFARTYSTFNIGISLATALGPALLGSLYHISTWEVTVTALSAVCAVAGIVVFLFTGGRGQQEEDSD
ncbi:hypothetical protein CBER1_06123 [Cercospora berteroae]|uniref:Major facilitator superfamily (MFS) profile domain-containing protein n=1 Tax=Cercospora berteroae TaxID=357750 RepID=A0A2S6C3K2_9PEZI|nr:hypothetical protein CBER1_06123 [Cercospora berteroae]